MKAHLIVLFLCFFVVSCNNMQKPVMDVISDPVTPVAETFGDVPRITVSDAVMQDSITGPWLWMIAPAESRAAGPIDIDSLAVSSDGVVTEMDVATNGVATGDMVGDLTWTPGTIWFRESVIFPDNINDFVNEIGWGEGNIDDYTSYALINLVSDTDSDVTMQVVFDDHIKVWANGEVVYKSTEWGVHSGEFKVDLKAGSNLLMVKITEFGGYWGMFIGIEDP